MNEGKPSGGQQPDDWDAELARQAQAAEATFWGYLGCELVAVSDARAVVRLSVRPHHLNLLRIVHGGVIASLLDNAMGVAAMSALRAAETVTAGLNVHYTAPARGAVLTATSEVVHRSRRSLTLTGTVTDADGGVCAIGTATYRMIGVASQPAAP